MKSLIDRLIALAVKHWELLSILVGGTIIRFYNLTSVSLWHDEAFSALLIRYSWGEMIYRIGLDVHPPMYYIFLRFWHYIFGNSLLSLRGMSVLFGVGTIAIVYLLAKEAFNNKQVGIIAALLVAVNPFQIQYVSEARMYTMGAFFAVLAAYALVKALRIQKHLYESTAKLTWQHRNQYVWLYLTFAISSSIALLTHYYLLFTIAALGLYGLWFHLRVYGFNFKRYGWIILSGIFMLVAFSPWFTWFQYQFKQVGEGYWIPKMDIWSIPRTLYEMTVKIAEPSKLIMVIVTLFALIAIYKLIKHYSEKEKWLILGAFLTPFLGAVVFYILTVLKGGSSSVYVTRYFIFSSTFYLIIIALFFNSFTIKRFRNALVIWFTCLSLFSTGYYWYDLDVSTKQGMSAAAKYLEANVEPNHKLYVASSFVFFNYKYYNRTPVKPLLYSGGLTEAKQISHFAGSAILHNDDLLPDYKVGVNKGDTVWVLWTYGFGGKEPQVPSNWTKIDEHGYNEVRPYVNAYIMVSQFKVN